MKAHYNTVPDGVDVLANELGWKTVFFTSKLQLQKQISRQRQRTEEQNNQERTEFNITNLIHITDNDRGDWSALE